MRTPKRSLRYTSMFGLLILMVVALVGPAGVTQAGVTQAQTPKHTNLKKIRSVKRAIARGDKRCPGQPYFRYVGGKPDNYAAPADLSYPSPNLGGPLFPNNARTDYDGNVNNQVFGDSFNLQNGRGVCNAVIQVKARGTGDVRSNDTLNVGQVDSGGAFHTAAQLVPPTLGSVWEFTPTGVGLLSAITGKPTPAETVLDVSVQDDTTIDFMMLWVWYSTPTPLSCTISGTTNADTLAGTPNSEGICGLAGDDSLSGNAGDDTLRGGLGNDVLNGGPGTDICDGGPGTDTVTNCETLIGIP